MQKEERVRDQSLAISLSRSGNRVRGRRNLGLKSVRNLNASRSEPRQPDRLYGVLRILALSLRTIPIGIAYAMWAGLGIVLIALVGWFWFRQTLDVPALIGLALIVGGVFLVNAFSQSLPH